MRHIGYGRLILGVVLLAAGSTVQAADADLAAAEISRYESVNAALGGQQGDDLHLRVRQIGAGNVATLRQSATRSRARIDQFGNNNRADIRQDGEDNFADILQDGADNAASIHQQGDGLRGSIVQRGVGNRYELNLAGSGNSGIRVTQVGVAAPAVTITSY